MPNPALILQMPHSENGIIHYEAVVPNLTMSLDKLIEASNRPTCYCGNVATLECKTCSKLQGRNRSILYCDSCQSVKDEIHSGAGHDIKMTLITDFDNISTSLALTAIVCQKNNKYSIFLKDGRETYSAWIYVHKIENGRLEVKFIIRLLSCVHLNLWCFR